MKVLLTGATGVAGLATLRALLKDPSVSHVTVLARRPLPAWVKLPGSPPASSPDAPPTHPKLTALTQPSFLSYPPDLLPTLAEHDACIWALGTASRNVSESEYVEITEGYLNAFLGALEEAKVGSGEKPFRFVFVSGNGADSKGKSMILFARSKGRAENALFAFADGSSGKVKASVLRPAYFFPSPEYPEDAQHQRGATARFMHTVLSPVYSAMSMVTPVENLAEFAIQAAKGMWEDKGRLFENGEMNKLVQQAREKA